MASPFLNRVSLLIAFESVGERLFGAEWRGFEYQCAEGLAPPSPKDHGGRLNFLEGEQARLGKSIGAVYAARATCADEQIRAMFEPILKALNDASSDVGRELREREGDNQVKERRDTYERYEAARRLLIEALATGHLQAEADASSGIDRNLWSDASFGAINLRLSTVVRPEEQAPRGVSIVKRDFDRWLATIPDITGTKLDVDAWCRGQIANLRREGRPPPSQDALFDELSSQQSSLTKRTFLAAWKEVAPKTWKKPGRKSRKPR